MFCSVSKTLLPQSIVLEEKKYVLIFSVRILDSYGIHQKENSDPGPFKMARFRNPANVAKEQTQRGPSAPQQ